MSSSSQQEEKNHPQPPPAAAAAAENPVTGGDRKRSVEEAALSSSASPPAAYYHHPHHQPHPTMMSHHPPPPKMQKLDKAYKGLRHFSMLVCKKVEEKGSSNYKEVADELVEAILKEEFPKDDEDVAYANEAEKRKAEAKKIEDAKKEENNIRRRVYDAFNVLMAMDIISGDKKQIVWKGLPTSAAQDRDMLHRELVFRKAEVRRKREALKELLTQQVCFRNLVEHNLRRQGAVGGQEESKKANNKIPLPFLVVNTDKNAIIQCNMSRELTEVEFDFSMPFEINDDNTILKRLGLHRTSEEVLKQWMPQDMLDYCMKHGLVNEVLQTEKAPSPAPVPSSS